MLYTLLTIGVCFLFWLVGFLIIKGEGLFGRRAEPKLSTEPESTSPLIKIRTIGWQEIQSHVRLKELLSVQGKTLSGEDFQIILTLGIGTKLQVIYLRVGSIIHRVQAGQDGLVEIKQSDAIRLIFENHDITLTPLLSPSDAARPELMLGHNYFTLVLSLTNNLVDGVKISYAARCAQLGERFIKIWDIPNPQSDESIKAKISSISDLAVLAEKIKDVQLANLFNSRSKRAIPLDYGVCYLLGKSGGMRLRFVVDAEVAFLIVSEYNSRLDLGEFLNSLAVSAQMHAKIIQKDKSVILATQDKNGEYALVSLNQSNVLLGVGGESSAITPVIRLELDETIGGVLDVVYQVNVGFSNVLIWKNIAPPSRG